MTKGSILRRQTLTATFAQLAPHVQILVRHLQPVHQENTLLQVNLRALSVLKATTAQLLTKDLFLVELDTTQLQEQLLAASVQQETTALMQELALK